MVFQQVYATNAYLFTILVLLIVFTDLMLSTLKIMAGTESTPEVTNLVSLLSSFHRAKLWHFQFKTKKSVTSRKSGQNLYLWSLTFLNNMMTLSKCLIIYRIFSCGANQSFRLLNSTFGTEG